MSLYTAFAFGLLSPEDQKKHLARERERELEYIKRNAHRAVPWDLWKTKLPRRLNENLILDASTYDPGYKLFDPVPTTKYLDENPKTYVSYRKYRYRHLVLPKGERLQVPVFADRDNQPFAVFTDDVMIPSLAEFHHGRWEPWMGLSPAEMLSQRRGISFCRGKVAVIGGLGMGWFASEAVKLGKCDRLVVVEKSDDLIEWYGKRVCKELGIELVHDDIWNVVGKMPSGTRYALDIWRTWFEARYDSQLRKAKNAGHKIWAWGGPR